MVGPGAPPRHRPAPGRRLVLLAALLLAPALLAGGGCHWFQGSPGDPPQSGGPRHPGPVSSLAASPRWLVSAGFGGSLVVWDRTSGARAKTLTAPSSGVVSVTLAPNGYTLAALGSDETVELWDLRSGSRGLRFAAPRAEVVAFSRDGRTLVTGGARVTIWDAASGEQLFAHDLEASFGAAALDPFAARLAAAGGGRVRLFATSSGEVIYDREVEQGFRGSVHGVAFARDGALFAVGGDAVVFVFDAATGELLHELTRVSGYIQALAFSPTTGRLACASQNTVLLWDPRRGDLFRRLTGHTTQVTALDFAPDGTLYSAAQDGRIIRWDAASGRDVPFSEAP